MARITNSELLTKYREKMEQSRRWRTEERYDDLWSRLIDLYRGKHHRTDIKEDQLLVNIAFATINIIAPNISVNFPKIAVNAVKPENAANAVIAEAVVNYWWKHRDIRTEFRRSIKDMLTVGHGWVKVGYRFVEEEAIGTGDTEVSDPVEGGDGTPNTTVLEDSPFAERVSPGDVFVDPDATSMSDAKWIAQRIRRPIADVKNDKRYNKTARNKVQVMAVAKYSDDPSRRKVQDLSIGYAELYEFYDIAANTMCIFCDSGDYFLVEPVKMPYSFGQPFVMIRNYDVPDRFYPIGDLESIEPLQRELNETRTQMMNHRKKFSRKYLYKESSFDQQGRTALESDDDNVMVPVMSDEPLSGVVTAFPAVINPPEFYNQTSMIITDIDRISGVSEFQRGAVSEIRRTATESSLLQDAANARTSDKLAIVEQAIAEVGRRMVAMAQQYMTSEQVARVTGKDGEPIWITYDRDYLAGSFDFEVAAGSTQPHNESFQRQMALQLVDAMAPFAGAGIVNMQKLAAHVLQFGFGIKNPDEFIQAAPQMGPDGQPMPGAPPVDAAQPGGPEAPQGPESTLPPEIIAQLQAAQAQQQQGMPPQA